MSEWGTGRDTWGAPPPAYGGAGGYPQGPSYGLPWGAPAAPPWAMGPAPWTGPPASELPPIDVGRDTRYRVWVPVVSFQAGALPEVCPRSGFPSDKAKKKKFTNPVGIEALALLGGFIVFFIIRAILEKSATGMIPYAAAPRREVQKRRLLITGGVIVAISVLSAVLIDPAMLIIIALFAAVPLIGAGDVPPARGELDRAGNWLKLKNCHPGFAAAIQTSAVGPWAGVEEGNDPALSPIGWIALGVIGLCIVLLLLAAAV